MDSSDDAVIWSVHTVVAYMLVPSWGLAAPALRIGPENMCNTDHLTMVNVTCSCMRTYWCSRVPRWAVGGGGRGSTSRGGEGEDCNVKKP